MRFRFVARGHAVTSPFLDRGPFWHEFPPAYSFTAALFVSPTRSAEFRCHLPETRVWF
ncbi:hypothetical protein SAMCCGM7_Ch1954 [Sinorhizobium americanum CCGM7]|nr:hypothetical protein SAMCCGM7_Ch1954 [Sinorhizobium americanum CCGM7]